MVHERENSIYGFLTFSIGLTIRIKRIEVKYPTQKSVEQEKCVIFVRLRHKLAE